MPEAADRYTGKATRYVHGRPSYPAAALETAGDPLDPDAVVADVGSGTGKLSRLLLARGHRVLAVEPNAEMRAAAEAELGDHPRYRGVAGSAEATTLPPASVDVVAVAQALHWFDLAGARAEFRRVLRPGGEVLLLWNEPPADPPPARRELDALLAAVLDGYDLSVRSAPGVTALTAEFFAGLPHRTAVLPHAQVLDEEAFLARVLSISAAPVQGDPAWGPLVSGLRDLFHRRSTGGHLRIDYDLWVIRGRL